MKLNISDKKIKKFCFKNKKSFSPKGNYLLAHTIY